MQDLAAERACYDELFERNSDNEHIIGGYVRTFEFIHRAWDDRQSARLMHTVRRTHDVLVCWLPLRFRANKFLVVFERPAA